MAFLVSQALLPETLSPNHLFSLFALLSFPSPPKKLCSCFLLPLSWLGTREGGCLKWDTSSLSLSV